MGFFGNVIGKVRTAFSSDGAQKRALAKGISMGGSPTGYGRDAYQVFGFDPTSAYINIENDLISRYVDYEDMDDMAEIATALNILADETTQDDYERRTPIWIQSPDKTVEGLLDKDLLRTRLQFPNEELWDCARTLYKYGNVFYEHLLDNKGVVGLTYLPPATMRRIEGPKNDLYGFVQDFRGKYGYTPQEFQTLYKDRITNPEESAASSTGWNRVPRRPVAFEDWEVLHLRLRNRSRRSIYGVAILEGGRWIFKRLSLLEDSALIYRLQRAPERFAFYVDVGDLPPPEAMAYVNKIRQQYRKKKFFDACLTGDTLIECLDGKSRSIREMAQNKGDYWVYSFDLATGKVVPGKAVNARITGEKVPVYRVVLDSGATIRATGHHPFLMRDGTYRRCDQLVPDDRLMPLNLCRAKSERTNQKGYVAVKQPLTKKQDAVHTLVAKSLFAADMAAVIKRGDRVVVHHKDGIKSNNDPSNLEVLSVAEHQKLHFGLDRESRSSALSVSLKRKISDDPDFKDAVVQRLNAWRERDPDKVRQLCSVAGRSSIEARKEACAPANARIMELIKECLIRDPLLTREELVSTLNSNAEFSELYRKLPTTVHDTMSAACLDAWLRRQGFDGLKKLKIEVVGEAKSRYKEYGKPAKGNNHTVRSIEFDGYEDVYNLDVGEYANFALTAGVFVHNSTGKLNLRWEPLTSDEDFFIPVRKGREGARVEVLGAPQWQCLVGETEIPLLNGKSKTIQEMAEEGGSYWVYSSTLDGQVVPGKAHSARVSHESAEIWEVELDNKEVVRCTGNHPFLTRDGRWVLAEDLKAGDSMMPLYRRVHDRKRNNRKIKGYEEFLNPSTQSWMYTHHMVIGAGTDINKVWESNKIIHHKDRNKLNNTPENLVVMTRLEHALEHKDNADSMHRPDVQLKLRAIRASEPFKHKLRESWKNPARKAAHRKMMLERMQDPTQKSIHGEILADWNRSAGRREGMLGSNHPRWVDLTVEQLGEKLKASGARTMVNFVKLGGVSQGTVERILGAAKIRWCDFAPKYIPDWKPRGRAASKRVPEYVGNNHKVVSVRNTGKTERVYDLTVDEHHNFAIMQGIYSHNSMEDINYFKDKLFASIFVPKSYLAQEAGVSRQILTNQDVTVARIVMNTQRVITNAISRTCRIHLSALGMDPYQVPYSVHMAVPNSIYELAQLEVMNARVDFASRAKEFVSEYWILNKIFHFEDDDIAAIMQQRHEDLLRNSSMQSQAQAQSEFALSTVQQQIQTSRQLNQAQIMQATQNPDPKVLQQLQQQSALQQQQMLQAQAMTAQGGATQATPSKSKKSAKEDVDEQLRRVVDGWEAPGTRYSKSDVGGRYGRRSWEESIMRGDRGAEKRAEQKLEQLLKNDQKLANRLNEVGEMLRELRLATRPKNGNR